MEDKFPEVLLELQAMHDRKGSDYDKDEIPYFNIRGSAEWGIEPWVGAMVRANDKIKRLQKYATRGSLKNESVEDSLIDLAVYSIISLILWREAHATKAELELMNRAYA
jgi:hypothetical protein